MECANKRSGWQRLPGENLSRYSGTVPAEREARVHKGNEAKPMDPGCATLQIKKRQRDCRGWTNSALFPSKYSSTIV
jgi:hypothetical protein